MKKTVNVNIGGFSYNVDEDAYGTLRDYLDSINAGLGGGNEAAEVMGEIEERISELISAKIADGGAVSLGLVEEIIAQIGNPEDIGGSAEPGQKNEGGKPPRRLYRNPQNAIAGGVCSGLSEFFAIDPIVFRLLFIALVFAKGLGLILYLVLWIATPRAVTRKQKLEMKGEPVTFSNIEKVLKEEMGTVSAAIKNAEPRNFLEKLMNFIGQIALFCLKALLVFFKVLAVIIGVLITTTMLFVFLVLIGVFFFGNFMVGWLAPQVGDFSLNEFITSMFEIGSGVWVTLPVFLILAIPVVALIYGGVRVLFRFKARDGLIGIVASGVWIASVVTLAFVVFFQARGLAIRESSVSAVSLNGAAPGRGTTIALQSYSPSTASDSRYVFFDMELASRDGEKTLQGRPTLSIERSDGGGASITVTRKARGGSRAAARRNASEIAYSYSVSDSTVTLAPAYTLPASAKWKSQSITLVLSLPEGYSVYLDPTLAGLLDYNQPHSNHWPDEMLGKTWTMTKSGLREKR